MINMIVKQNEQLLNRGVQVEDVMGSHVCTPPHSQHGSGPMMQDMSQFENARCHLLYWYPYDNSEDQIVAECRISRTNPKDKIHNMPLGRGYWRVWIYAVFIDIKVCRSTDEYEMLSRAVGSSITRSGCASTTGTGPLLMWPKMIIEIDNMTLTLSLSLSIYIYIYMIFRQF
ncbi:hypothetical protein ACOSQ2_016328 [Xanthoceras sorbifolium]